MARTPTARFITTLLVSALPLLLGSRPVLAQELAQELVPDPTKSHKFFGERLAIDGDTMVAGDFNYMMESNCGQQEHGAVQVFKKVGTEWQRAEFFRYPDENPFDNQRHGWSVAVKGNVMVASTPGKRWESNGTTLLNAGALSIYKRPSATQPFAFVQHLFLPNPEQYDNLGFPVDMASNGTYAAVVSEKHRDLIRIFRVDPSPTYLTTIAYPYGAAPWAMAITSQNILVTDSGGFSAPFAWKLNGTQATPIDTSSLGGPYDVTTADLVGDGDTVAWLVQDGSFGGNLLRIAKFGADSVLSVDSRSILNASFGGLPMALKEGQGLFVATDSTELLASYKYVDGAYRYQGNTFQSPLQARSLAFNGTDLMVGDHTPTRPGPTICGDVFGSIWVYRPLAATAAGPGTSTALQPWVHTSVWSHGNAVAVSGSFAASAAPDTYQGASPSGGVLLYQKVNGAWQQVEEYRDAVSELRGGSWSGFGQSVDMNADFLAMGAPYGTNWWGVQTGLVEVAHKVNGQFQRGPFLQEVDTMNVDEVNEGFGTSVALSGNRLFVGAPAWSAEPGNPNAGGSVHVFEWTGTYWSFLGQIHGVGVQASEAFGYRIAASGDNLIVGIPYRSVGGQTSNGAVQIFRRDATGNYVFAGEFWGSTLQSYANLGSSVTIGADFAAAGSPTGTVIIYRRNGTSWAQHTGAPLTPGQFGFGNSVAIEGTSLLVGSPWENRVHRYQRVVTFGVARWLRGGTLTGNTSSFGTSVDVDGGQAMIGESYGSVAGRSTGASYVMNAFDIQ